MPDLTLPQKAKRLRIYFGESDRWRGKGLDSALLEIFRAQGLAGATVLRGIAGFGAHSFIHSTHLEALSFDLPLVIEVVDSPQKIDDVLHVVYPMLREGLMTVEEVEIVKYTHRYLNPLPADRLVSEVMTPRVFSLSPQASVHQVWNLMLENSVKAVPLVDGHSKVVGILTDEDLLQKAGLKGRLTVAVRMGASDANHELFSLEQSPLKAADIMTHPVITVQAADTLGTATARMVKSGLKRLPVVGEDGALVGILSRLDILRQVADAPHETPPLPTHPHAFKTVSGVMSGDIPTVSQDDDLSVIVEKFAQTDSHRLVVVDAARRVLGLISDADVIARVQPDLRPGILHAIRRLGKPPAGKETAFDLMSKKLLTAPPDMPVIEAVKKMLLESHKWLVVVDAGHKPLGLVDRRILLESISSTYRGS